MRSIWMKFVLPAALWTAAMPALAQAAQEEGRRAYASNCAMCHQADGSGLPGTFPPIAGRIGDIARSREGRAYLIKVVLYGLSGPITVDGRQYRGMMAPVSGLPDPVIAGILNHGATLGKPARKIAAFTADEVAAVRAGERRTGSDVAAERSRLADRKLIP